MQNLIHPRKKVLLTTIDKTVMGVYSDKDSVKKFVLKTEGIEIPAGNEKWTKQVTHDFVAKNVGLELLTGTLGASTDVGFKVVAKYKTPAYVDNSEYWPTGKYYGTNFASGTTELQIEAFIMDQIAKDLGISDSKNGAIVGAYRAYVITDDDNTDNSTITVTKADGTTATVTGSANAVDQLCTAFNVDANVNTVLKAFPIADDTILVVSVDPNYNYTIAAGTDTTIVRRELLLKSSQDDILFEIEHDTDVWSDTSYAIAEISSPDSTPFASASNLHILYNTTVNELTAGTNIATVTAAIEALTGIKASTRGTTKILVASTDSSKAFDITKPYINSAQTAPFTSTVVLEDITTAKGAYSNLTADDVQRIFATSDHAGDLTSAIRKTQTVAGAEYVRFLLTSSSATPALEGANHLSAYKHELEIFIPKNALRADLFVNGSWFADTGTGDRTIDELLKYWEA